MVSLKKEPSKNEQPVREYTPVHLMDEEEAIRTFCPTKVPPVPDIKTDVKQTDEELLPVTKNPDIVNLQSDEEEEFLVPILPRIKKDKNFWKNIIFDNPMLIYALICLISFLCIVGLAILCMELI